MKLTGTVLSLVFAATSVVAPLAHASATPNGATDVFQTPAFASFCKAGVMAHPRRAGFWHLAYPKYAVTTDLVYATLELPPNDKGQYAVVTIDPAQPDEPRELTRFKEGIQDLSFHNGSLWILFRDHLAEVQPKTGELLFEIQTAEMVPIEDARAHAFAWIGDKLVIAHGTGGTRTFDLSTRQLTEFNKLDMYVSGQLSKTIDVQMLTESQAIFAVENVSVSNDPPYPFEGMIVMNLADGSIAGRYPYDRKESGSISNAFIKVLNERIYVNNWGTLQTVSLQSMETQKKVLMTWKPTRVDVKGRLTTVDLLGEPLLRGKELISCGHLTYQDLETRKIVHEGIVYRTSL
jgi:hypothetical protein